jgi:hypothetical protein
MGGREKAGETQLWMTKKLEASERDELASQQLAHGQQVRRPASHFVVFHLLGKERVGGGGSSREDGGEKQRQKDRRRAQERTGRGGRYGRARRAEDGR